MSQAHTIHAEHTPHHGDLISGILIGLISFLTLIDLFAAQAILPALAETYQVSAAAMSSAVNASTFGMAAGSLLIALVARKVNRRHGIWIALALLAAPTVLLANADNLGWFATLRVAQGLCMAAAFTLTMAYLAEECTPIQAAGALAAYITGNVASNLVGRLIAANLVEAVGVSSSFYVFAGLNLAGALVAYLYINPSAKDPTKSMSPVSPFESWAQHLRTPGLPAAFIGGFLILFVFLGVFTYINFVLAGPRFGLSTGELGLVYLVFLPSMITTPLAGPMVRRYGVRLSLYVGLAIAVFGLALTLPSSLPAVLFGMALVGVGTFAAQAAITGYVSSTAIGDRAAASGIYLTAYYLGGLIGTFILGVVFMGAGWVGVTVGSTVALAAIAALSVRFS